MLSFKLQMTKTSPESEAPEDKPVIKSELKGERYKISKSRVTLSSKTTVQVTHIILNFLMAILKKTGEIKFHICSFNTQSIFRKLLRYFIYFFHTKSLMSCVFSTDSASPFRQVSPQVLDSLMWLVTTVAKTGDFQMKVSKTPVRVEATESKNVSCRMYLKGIKVILWMLSTIYFRVLL